MSVADVGQELWNKTAQCVVSGESDTSFFKLKVAFELLII